MLEYKDYYNYKVYTNGMIFSNYSNKFLKPGLITDGYHQVCLTINKKLKRMLVHRLVCLCFLPNIYNKPTVNHKDWNTTNNSIFNLEWATHLEQANHRRIMKTNTSGCTGVYYYKQSNKWIAQLKINKKCHSKSFKTFDEACNYRQELELLYHYS